MAEGSSRNAGSFLQADLEGLSIIASRRGRTVLLASSQGDSSFHFNEIDAARTRHLGAFLVEGVGETDGVDYVPHPIGPGIRVASWSFRTARRPNRQTPAT